MQKISRNIFLVSITAFSLLLMSWGYNGHHKINEGAPLSFNPEMEQFMTWAAMLAEHASDADARKDEDPNEEPRHYIDIDNYPGFITDGRIPQTYDSVVALYGVAFVIDQGVLPWATKITYDSLVNSFIRFDWAKAVLFASDLGHYVADAHQPLHITRNYNGQYTNNYDIHSRYETGMINAFQNQIDISGDAISFIPDVNGYIFKYIYSNYIYVDSIMAADDYALATAGNNSSYQYKEALWEKCGGFTTGLFNRASRALAELIYTAWVEAGRPDMNSGPGIFELAGNDDLLELKINPNPVKGDAQISFYLPESSNIVLTLFNIKGNIQKNLNVKNLPAGLHKFSFDVSNLPEGLYFIMVDAGKYRDAIKMIKNTLN